MSEQDEEKYLHVPSFFLKSYDLFNLTPGDKQMLDELDAIGKMEYEKIMKSIKDKIDREDT